MRKSRPISLIWLIPIIAALVGAFLAWKTFSEQGPTITIYFEDAEGLEAEKTKIKYKDVQVGLVEKIGFTEDLSRVRVTASLSAGLERYLTENTRFWVVRAQISAGRITGLGTVLGGSYIAVDLSEEGRRKREFDGLETAPVITSDDEGTLFTLRADSLGSLDLGAPVYFRSLEVGRLVAHELDASGDFVTIRIFVRAPHDARIDRGTRFWNAAGLDVDVNAEGVRIDTPSLVSMLVGGIAFENFERFDEEGSVDDETVFTLFPNKQATMRPHYTRKVRYLAHFDQSVSGLSPGAPVEFRGIKLGEVLDVKLVYDYEADALRIPVVLEIEPERITPAGGAREDRTGHEIPELVEEGLRARLVTGNVLTGQLKVELDFVDDPEPAEIRHGGAYPELPTVPGTLGQITKSLASAMSKLEQVPIAEIGDKVDRLLSQLDRTLVSLQDVSRQLEREIGPRLAATLGSLEKTLDAVNDVLGSDSATTSEVESAVRDLGDAARSLRVLTDRLERRPEELLRGKSR